MKHVDDFIDDVCVAKEERYAQFFFFLHRLPAWQQAHYAPWISQYKLFCTWKGRRWRVTGASRMGDIWLADNFKRDVGYDHRVDLEECSEWSNEPTRKEARDDQKRI